MEAVRNLLSENALLRAEVERHETNSRLQMERAVKAEAENKCLIEKVTELRANIHENGNKAQVIMAGEVLEMRKNTARKCVDLIENLDDDNPDHCGCGHSFISSINDKFGLTTEESND